MSSLSPPAPSGGCDPVYRRTSDGQHEAVFGQQLLDPDLRQLLLLVTGYTPRSRLHGGQAGDHGLFDVLISRGLIREVKASPPRFVALASGHDTDPVPSSRDH